MTGQTISLVMTIVFVIALPLVTYLVVKGIDE